MRIRVLAFTIIIFVISLILLGCVSGVSAVETFNLSDLEGYWIPANENIAYLFFDYDEKGLVLYNAFPFLEKNGMYDKYDNIKFNKKTEEFIITVEEQMTFDNDYFKNGIFLNGEYQILCEIFFVFRNDDPYTLKDEKAILAQKFHYYVFLEGEYVFWKTDHIAQQDQESSRWIKDVKPPSIMSFFPEPILKCTFSEEGVPSDLLKKDSEYTLIFEAIPDKVFPFCSKQATVSFVSVDETISFSSFGMKDSYKEKNDVFIINPDDFWVGEWIWIPIGENLDITMGSIVWTDKNDERQSVKIRAADAFKFNGEYEILPTGTITIEGMDDVYENNEVVVINIPDRNMIINTIDYEEYTYSANNSQFKFVATDTKKNQSLKFEAYFSHGGLLVENRGLDDIYGEININDNNITFTGTRTTGPF
ncbi:MAG: hypothetical protein PWQ84_1731 [Thermotogaceae bacterium]|jgi:hypothetical protein|nr:hypothetical protein [Thermotogaceae bacterium]